MTSWIGKSIAHYRVTAQIGAGGMGEVYRASDSRLGRDVAIKVLPAAFAADQERMARFEREAKLLASLSHSNIAAIFGLEELDGARAIVMELVEGPTLADRIVQGALPVEEALPLAKQIAEALEYAHEHGVIHRDLKPANIKITPDGSVKILDFGLAKAFSDDATGSGSDLSKSPTLTAASTRLGVILGTAAYMPPEQAKGKTVDRRADVWSFGAVLFEMLAGKQAFLGETVSETLASVMKDEPAFAALPASVPARIRDLIRRCLVKDPKQRLRDMGDARIRIDEELSGVSEPVSAAASAAANARRGLRAPVVLAIALAAVAAGIVGGWMARKPVATPAYTASLVLPDDLVLDDDDGGVAISPDGRRVVVVAQKGADRQSLWLHEFDRDDWVALKGTNGATYPFWSPDGANLGFFADRKLKRVGREGGVAQSICEAVSGRGGAWGPDGRIVISSGPLQGLSVVSAAGGEPVDVTTLEREGITHRLPRFLPDGKRVLFVIGNQSDVTPTVECVDLDSGERVKVMTSQTEARWVEGGYVTYVLDNNLVIQRFDPKSLKVSGEPVPLVSGVGFNPFRFTGTFDVSGRGPAVFSRQLQSLPVNTVLYDFEGNKIGDMGTSALVLFARYSPDGRRLVTIERTDGDFAIWMTDVATRVRSRLAVGVPAAYPAWSPDGRYVFFGDGAGTAYRASSTGGGKAEPLGPTRSYSFFPLDVSRDGKTVVGNIQMPKTGLDLFVMNLETDSLPRPLMESKGEQGNARFSPDGRWLVVEDGESESTEVYVLSWPGLGNRWQVSSQGGSDPLWSQDGSAIYYLGTDDTLRRAEVDGSGNDFVVKGERTLFGGQPMPGLFALTPDGKGLLVLVREQAQAVRLELMTDWRARLTATSR